MSCELISIDTPTLPLDGAFYRPSSRPMGSAMLFHGGLLNFYTGVNRYLPPALTEIGYACLAFNRRSHDILGIYDSVKPVGAAMWLIEEDIEDNCRAGQWLKAQVPIPPVVVGHSHGGTLAVKHEADHRNSRALVLLSPHAGKPMVQKTGWFNLPAAASIVANARAMVAAGKGDELIQLPAFWYIASAKSLIDRIDNVPDILELAPEVTCPVLFLRGEGESADIYPAEGFKSRCGGPCEIRIVSGVDHFYKDSQTVRKIIVEWLSRLPTSE